MTSHFLHPLIPSLVLGLCGFVMGAHAHEREGDDSSGRQAYDNHVLVSNGTIKADFSDANLLNAWGIAFNPNGPVWVADNHSGKATLYDGTGKPLSLVVTIPGVGGAQGDPTGIVFTGGTDFVVSGSNSTGTVKGPARFIFATESGTLAAWAPDVNPTVAITVADNSASNAVYKGLAVSGTGAGHLLYATDFHNNRVDIFDADFKPVHKSGAFVDSQLPAGYAPFGIQAIGGDIYVTYAKQDADAKDDAHGPGRGFVDVYDANGVLLGRVASHGALNSPWGIALAPATFGEFGGALLIGNFGDGAINAYDLRTDHFLGTVRDENGKTIKVDGLWGIAFGNGVSSQKTNSLYYAAGPNGEADGLYGVINAVTDNK